MRKIVILTTLLVCLSTFILEKAFSGIVPENFDKKYKTPLVLTVDGMSPSATFSPTEKLRESYLSKALQNTESFKVINPGNQEIPSFGWSGDITKSSQEIMDLKIVILALAQKANKEDRSFSIISHSWGTVLTYCALKELEKEGKLKDGDIDRLITLGSPMGGKQLSPSEILLKSHSLAKDYISTELKEEPGKLSKPKGVTEWVNYWSQGDPFSGEISAADYNSKVSGGHDTYYTDSKDSNITWKIAREIAMGAKDNVIGNSANSSQQAVINTSAQEAIKYADLTYKIPFAKISPELAKKLTNQQVSMSSSQQAAYTPQSLVNTQNVYYTENIVGSWLGSRNQTFGYTETLNFSRGGTFVNTSDQGGRYSGTYSLNTSGSSPQLTFAVTSTNLGVGTFNQLGDYGRGINVQGNKMTLTSDTSSENLMVNGYTKQ